MGLASRLATNTSRLLKNVRMFREPQHERNYLNHFKSLSVRPETCMRDVVVNAECSVTGTVVKILAVEPKEALRWEIRHSSLVTMMCLPDSMWTREASR